MTTSTRSLLGERVRTGQRVVGVARADRDLLVDSGRKGPPFVVHVQGRDGRATRLAARAVVDCSGTWGSPNSLGAEGYPAVGESTAADRILYRMPEPDHHLARYTGAATAVVGSGASALTVLIALTSTRLRTPPLDTVRDIRDDIQQRVSTLLRELDI